MFANSRYRVFAFEDGRLVGAGRALADGADCSYICDVAVLPSHQGTGLGKQIVSRLVALSRGHRKIILYSVPGKEPFYRKLGFRACSRRWRSSGFRRRSSNAATSPKAEHHACVFMRKSP